MIDEVKQKNKTIHYIVIFLLFIIIIGGVIYCFSMYNKVGFSDFSRRYRESRYIATGINPFDVVYGNVPINNNIGHLERNSGYPPWSMVMGIVTNFTMFSESIATKLTLLLMIVNVAVAGFVLFRYAKKQKWLLEQCVICSMAGMAVFGFWTGISFLNFGSVIGLLLLLFVFLEEKHPIIAGLLLSVAAIKPVLALPFFLALLMKKNWKSLISASILPLFSWVIACILTNTSPFIMLNQMSVEGNTYWSNSFISEVSELFNSSFSTQVDNLLSALFCIGLAIILWILLGKTKNNLVYFAIPAVLSGCWMYSQEHDRTVMLILMLALMKYLFEKNYEFKRLVMVILGSIIIGRLVFSNLISMLIGFSSYTVLSIIFRMLWIVGLIILVVKERENTQIETKESVQINGRDCSTDSML